MTDQIQYSNSKELLQPNYLKEWKGFTVTRQLSEGESLLDCAKGLVADVEELHRLYSQSIDNQMKGTVVKPVDGDKEAEAQISKAFEELKEKIKNATSKASSGQLLFDSEFKHNTELKQLVNEKQ